MRKYLFALQGVALSVGGAIVGWASYGFALSSGNPLGLALTFLSLPVLYSGLSRIRECEFTEDALVIRDPVFRDESRIPYESIDDVRLTYAKFLITPPSYSLMILHEQGSDRVGFGFRIDEDFLAALEERIGPERIFRHDGV